MRVLNIINTLNVGGAEKLLTDSIPLLNNNNVFAEVLVLKKSPSFLTDFLTNNNYKVYELESFSLYNPLNIFRIIPFLKRYDLIHVHLFPALYWTAIAKIISFSKAKLVFTEHSTSNRRWKNRIFQVSDIFIYQQYSEIICITEQVKASLLKNVPRLKSNLKVIENGIDLKVYKNAISIDKHAINSQLVNTDKLIVQVSAFRIEKDQETLIKAVSYLPENCKLLLVGEGERLVICQQLVRQLHLENRIFFLGARNDVPAILKSADICVLSSHWEGFGLVAVESMAAGVPIIASNVSGLSNVVGDERLLFQPGDSKQLAEKIIGLLTDESLYERLREYCLQRASKFSIEKTIIKQIEFYNEVLNRE